MRSSGILMHISSLPGPYGIGTMGKEARKFVDFLAGSAQTYWQVLPLSPTGYGDSPYQSFSGFAGNPYFIDLDILCRDRLLTKAECASYPWGKNETAVDYGVLYQSRYTLFHKAFVRFQKKLPADYEVFCRKQAAWLDDYALFMALKDRHEGASWLTWEHDIKYRKAEALDKAGEELAEEISFWKMLQYLFYKQWFALKDYANQKGIRIIGDTPIYVSADSVDVWANPGQFLLDDDLYPTEVAGCPPDGFAPEGQLWGNPLFAWDVMKQDKYEWWKNRIAHMAYIYDIVRIDHFRGFDSFYAIPYEDENAVRGIWKPGPGLDLFRSLKEQLGEIDIIVEDLGFLTPSVLKLVKDTGFPGMMVLEFAFYVGGEDGDYLPHNADKNRVIYVGTHDNETIMGWMKSQRKRNVDYAKKYLRLSEEEGYNWGFMRGAWSSAANYAIVTMQDILGLDNKARMNAPSTVGKNWTWRMEPGVIGKELAKKIRGYVELYGRAPRKKKAE